MDDLQVKPLQILINKANAVVAELIALSPNLVAALLIVLLTWGMVRVIRAGLRRGFRRAHMRPALIDALAALTSLLLWVAGVLLAATVAVPGVTPANVIAGLGLGSLIVGLAFKDIFENYLAGLLILLRKPMRIGDFIECEGIEGQVQVIRFRDSYIRRTDGVLVMLPNSFLYKNPVRVLTDLDVRRVMLHVGVAYGENVGAARSVIEQAMQDLRTVNYDRPVQVFAREFADYAIEFEVAWWTGSRPVDVRRSRDEVVEAIKSALDRAGIEIPFPYRTLTFKHPLALSRRDDEAAD